MDDLVHHDDMSVRSDCVRIHVDLQLQILPHSPNGKGPGLEVEWVRPSQIARGGDDLEVHPESECR
jgi:hypothetical protein